MQTAGAARTLARRQPRSTTGGIPFQGGKRGICQPFDGHFPLGRRHDRESSMMRMMRDDQLRFPEFLGQLPARLHTPTASVSVYRGMPLGSQGTGRDPVGVLWQIATIRNYSPTIRQNSLTEPAENLIPSSFNMRTNIIGTATNRHPNARRTPAVTDADGPGFDLVGPRRRWRGKL